MLILELLSITIKHQAWLHLILVRAGTKMQLSYFFFLNFPKLRFMKILPFLSCLILFLALACTPEDQQHAVKKASTNSAESNRAEYTIVIHGGAGSMQKKFTTPAQEQAITKILNEALDKGETILKKGGSAMDAVEQTIMLMENSPHFNAGKGAVLTYDGTNELDASFMNGKTLQAGAVGGVTIVKNPIRAARAVLEQSPHVLLTGAGADTYAKEVGLEIVENSYFFTEKSKKALDRVKAEERKTGSYFKENPDAKYGTVGCVALDKKGNLAAGTSTGGMTNKRYNRIGDSPIIGAGTYANNNTCAVSCTGHGEFFIRYAVAYDMSALMEYKGLGVQEAANHIINEKLKAVDGAGGLIAVDKNGNVAMPFNTPGMYRGYSKPGERVVKVYGEGE